jgi:hypothetical protein
MPQVGFEPTIPVFEQAKTVHASERGHCDRLCEHTTQSKTETNDGDIIKNKKVRAIHCHSTSGCYAIPTRYKIALFSFDAVMPAPP